MSTNIKRNIGLQTAFQIINTCVPLITAPYLARRLGAIQQGVFSFTSSVVAYFTLIAMLGTVNYGTRSIASEAKDKHKRSKTFWEIYSLQLSVTVFACSLYFAYLKFFCKDNNTIASLQIISLVACFFDINWFFFGIEEFRVTVTRSIFVRVLTVVLILTSVKTENDLWIYTVIMLGGNVLSQIILFFYLPRYISFVHIEFKGVISHLKPNLILFMPLMAMSVYHTMDKTMLGWLSTYEQSGFYYNSDKVINIPMSIINGIGTVMLPRISSLIGEDKQNEANRLFLYTLEGAIAVSVALCCGIAAVSNEFIPIFYGAGFDQCILLTKLFSPILVIKSISVIVRTQYLIPMKLEREFTKSVIGGALVNLVFNLMMIPQYGAEGAVIATFVAEFVACVLQLIPLKGKVEGLSKIFRAGTTYLLVGFIMIIVVRTVSIIRVVGLIKLVIEIIVGTIFYSCIAGTLWKSKQPGKCLSPLKANHKND